MSENNKKPKICLIKRDGKPLFYSHTWSCKLIRIAANTILSEMSDDEIDAADKRFYQELLGCEKCVVPYEKWRDCIRRALADYPEVCNAYLSAHKEENALCFQNICAEMSAIVKSGDQSNGSMDSSLCSSRRSAYYRTLRHPT